MKSRHSHAFMEWRRPRRHYSKNLSKIGWSVFELWIFEVLVNPYYGHLQVGKLRQNLWCHCGILSIGYVQRVSLFSNFHQKIFPPVYFFSMTWLHLFCITSERISTIALLIVYKKNNFVKLSVHNQWRVEHNDITDSGGVANLRKSIIRIY